MRRPIAAAVPAPSLAALALAVSTVAVAQGAAPAADPANTLVMELKYGKVTIQLRPDLAPKHVERVKTLAKQGFYNGQKFHRVIEGFMAQSGDPTGTGAGGSKLGNLPAEFSVSERYRRGTVGAARTADPNSANSQFFICFTDFGCDTLNGKYTIWGRVTGGMQYVDAVKRGEPPLEPDTIQRMYVAADGPGATPAKK
jgi:peptidylprolyl isomerase